MQGTIIKISRVRRYGFISTENGERFFFYHADLKNISIEEIELGNNVVFNESRGPNGLCNEIINLAEDIRILENL